MRDLRQPLSKPHLLGLPIEIMKLPTWLGPLPLIEATRKIELTNLNHLEGPSLLETRDEPPQSQIIHAIAQGCQPLLR